MFHRIHRIHRLRADRVILASVAISGALLLTACSSNSAAPPAPTTPTTTTGTASSPTAATPTAATPTAAPPSTAPAADVNVCSLLSAATVSSLTGNTYVSATPNVLGPGVNACDYSITGPYDLSVAIYEPTSTSADMNDLILTIGGASTAKAVSGVGDEAFESPIGVVAKFGNRFVDVGAPVTVFAPTGPEVGYVAVAKALIAAAQ
jgi:hypothetical protein